MRETRPVVKKQIGERWVGAMMYALPKMPIVVDLMLSVFRYDSTLDRSMNYKEINFGKSLHSQQKKKEKKLARVFVTLSRHFLQCHRYRHRVDSIAVLLTMISQTTVVVAAAASLVAPSMRCATVFETWYAHRRTTLVCFCFEKPQ